MNDHHAAPTVYEREDWVAVTDAANALLRALTFEGGEVARLLARPPDDTADVLRAVRVLADRVDDAVRSARAEFDRVTRAARLRRELLERRQTQPAAVDVFPSIPNGGGS